MSHSRLKAAARRGALLECLESRRLLSVSQIDFSNFASTTGLVLTGYGKSAETTKNQLILTDGLPQEGRSVYWGTQVGTQTFNTSFQFQIQPGLTIADGFTFLLQNKGATALGLEGDALGYQGITRSVAVSFALYDFNTNTFVSDFRFMDDGEEATNVTPITMKHMDLHGGDKFEVNVAYDGTTLTVNVVDLAKRTDTFSDSEVIDLHSELKGFTAYAGFTASTGLDDATQRILSWSYSGTQPVSAPTVATPAAAAQSTVTANTDALSVLGADVDGPYGLTYTWSEIQAPAGAKAVLFSANGDYAAMDTTATFLKDGHYIFQCTITDINGLSTTSDVSVQVNQTATELKLAPHGETIKENGQLQFVAEVFDQFKHAVRGQPTFDYSVLSGPGSIDASGLYSASTKTGHAVIKATGDGLSGTAALLIDA